MMSLRSYLKRHYTKFLGCRIEDVVVLIRRARLKTPVTAELVAKEFASITAERAMTPEQRAADKERKRNATLTRKAEIETEAEEASTQRGTDAPAPRDAQADRRLLGRRR